MLASEPHGASAKSRWNRPSRCDVFGINKSIMPKKIALLFAGQGAQSVGMGHELANQFPTAAEMFQQADEILGRKLSEIA